MMSKAYLMKSQTLPKKSVPLLRLLKSSPINSNIWLMKDVLEDLYRSFFLMLILIIIK